MTKEEIFNNNWKFTSGPPILGMSSIFQSMDEYAKQQAIAFDKFKMSNGFKECYQGVHAEPYYIRSITIGDQTRHERIGFDVIYNQFIEQQNKQG